MTAHYFNYVPSDNVRAYTDHTIHLHTKRETIIQLVQTWIIPSIKRQYLTMIQPTIRGILRAFISGV